MAGTFSGPSLFLPSSDFPSSLNAPTRLHSPILFPLFLSHPPSFPFSSHPRNFSVMSTLRSNAPRCHCSSASTTTNGISAHPSLLVFSGNFSVFVISPHFFLDTRGINFQEFIFGSSSSFSLFMIMKGETEPNWV